MAYTQDEMTAGQRDRILAEIALEREPKMNYANLGKACEPDEPERPSKGGYAIGGCDMAARTLSERFTLQNIDDAMNYQPWTRDQQEAGAVVREALTAAAKAILRSVPDCPFRTVALRNIIDARMNSNAAISFRGRF